jgi:hypothetical protein
MTGEAVAACFRSSVWTVHPVRSDNSGVIEFSRYGRSTGSVFDLLGQREVELTASLGCVLAKSPSLMNSLLSVLGLAAGADEVSVALEVADEYGRTDIELVTSRLKVVIEAKQGWLVPGEEQLDRYAGRFDGFDLGLLVSLSDSSERWARDQLLPEVRGIPVRHLAWDAVRGSLSAAIRNSRGRERFWLEELEGYMGAATSRRPPDDQWVFCVVVSDTLLGGVSFKEYVTRERVYFHPCGGFNTWPKRPPNLLCFRWGGQVQQVNRVSRFEIVPHLSQRFPSVRADETDGAHIVYDLGPNIPVPAISTKGTYATGREWCLLDQLLTRPTLREAVWSSDALVRGDLSTPFDQG